MKIEIRHNWNGDDPTEDEAEALLAAAKCLLPDIDHRETRLADIACALFGYEAQSLTAFVVEVDDDHTIIEFRSN